MLISDLKNDGYGAQLLAKVTCYVFACHYNFDYKHTPIKKCHHSNLNDLDNFFKITSNTDNNGAGSYKKITVTREPTIFKTIIEKGGHYNIEMCHWFLETNPDLYYNETMINTLRTMYYKTEIKHSNLFNKCKQNKKTILSIHVRRNDVTQKRHSNKFVELWKIEKFIKDIKEKYENLSIIIYTDSTNNEMNKLISDNVFVNKCCIKETFHDFVESDMLFVGISSFSYTPAILNKGTIFFVENYLFKGLKHWNKIVY